MEISRRFATPTPEEQAQGGKKGKIVVSWYLLVFRREKIKAERFYFCLVWYSFFLKFLSIRTGVRLKER